MNDAIQQPSFPRKRESRRLTKSPTKWDNSSNLALSAEGTSSHSTRLQKTPAKSLVIRGDCSTSWIPAFAGMTMWWVLQLLHSFRALSSFMKSSIGAITPSLSTRMPVTLGCFNSLASCDHPMDCCAAMPAVFWSGILSGITPTGYRSGTGNTPAEGQWHWSSRSPLPDPLSANDRAGW